MPCFAFIVPFRDPPPKRWCNTCQVYYTGDLIQHRRTQEHKVREPLMLRRPPCVPQPDQVGEGVRVGVGCKVYFCLHVTVTHVTSGESVMFSLGFYFAHLFSVGTSSPCYSASTLLRCLWWLSSLLACLCCHLPPHIVRRTDFACPIVGSELS